LINFHNSQFCIQWLPQFQKFSFISIISKNHKSKTCVEAYKPLPFRTFSQVDTFGHFFWLISGNKHFYCLLILRKQPAESQLGCLILLCIFPAVLEIIVIVYFVVCLLVMNEQTTEYDITSQ